ncbi:uncharacterized protein FA14DRAFT_54019 [Meira miltonrushii]|uniref:Uncharacterized protein n=1 Tax=Meira miltonrushii TaxID=1280837 RepID=A0A316VJV9_9BASI|nr:uncharacterized protein FA14DRAFT_54019 [Meira miltonrushii]PWN36311.1 hypothetical protein FA14DRAFT_54019 [Meira miltonrushii]
MGGGARYPYPKEVWSPSGGWWTRPSNWRTNTAVCIAGIGLVSYFTWMYSAKVEQRHVKVDRWIPSLHWAEEFKGSEYDELRKNGRKSSQPKDH